MRVKLDKMNEAHVGAWVIYRDRPGGRPQRGRIKSWNGKVVFVVYHCNGEWDRFMDFTAEATDPHDLIFRREGQEKRNPKNPIIPQKREGG